MVGFDDGTEKTRTLDGAPVSTINADLTGTLDLTSAKQLMENEGICLRADEKGGPFDIPYMVAQGMLQTPLNINGRPNSDVVRPWITAIDTTRRPRDMWIIDFGVNLSHEQAAQYEMPFQYVEQHVKPIRASNRMPRLREQWWLHRIPGAKMRSELLRLERYIVTPVTAKHRVFAWVPSGVLPDITVSVFAREDDYFFGVLQSRAHELWSLRMGTTLEDRPRYTPTTCFETFPLPWPPRKEPEGDSRIEAIAEAARHLDELRRNWLDPEGASEADLKKLTLTNLYNARPTWLDNAHKKLDAAVFAAYGWPEDIADEDILKNLLALNLERSERGAPLIHPTS
jgi:type II restriction/modification system DNA methylase subunit YeeA